MSISDKIACNKIFLSLVIEASNRATAVFRAQRHGRIMLFVKYIYPSLCYFHLEFGGVGSFIQHIGGFQKIRKRPWRIRFAWLNAQNPVASKHLRLVCFKVISGRIPLPMRGRDIKELNMIGSFYAIFTVSYFASFFFNGVL